MPSAQQIPNALAGADFIIDDPGNGKAIPVDRWGTVRIVTTAAETRTVANPAKVGIELTLEMMTDGGDCTITFASAMTEAGDTTYVLSDPGQIAVFRSVATSTTAFAWRKISSDPTEAATITTLTATTVNASTFNVSNAVILDASTGNTGLNYDDRATVTQITSITTGVTIDALAGVITTVSSTLAADATVEFVVTNSDVAAGDVIVCTCDSASAGTPVADVTDTAAGSFTIALQNVHDSAALDNTVAISFAVIKLSA